MIRDEHTIRCINGKYTGCGKCVGYCSYNGHPGYLTRDLRQQHNCIKKGCYYYVRKNSQSATTEPAPYIKALMNFSIVSVNHT